MRASPHPSEERRLAALRAYGILDTPRESDFDGLVQLAAKICDTPISVVNLIDAERQWFKAEVGLGVRETPIDSSICAHAILEDDLVEIPDTAQDERFADNPLVHAGPGLRFYAGALLKSPEGLPIGTLCVLDTKPRRLTDLQREALRTLSGQVVAQLELRRTVREMDEKAQAIAQQRAELGRTLENAEVATFDWDAAADRVFANSLLALFFGVNEEDASGGPISSYFAAIHGDDRERVQATIGESLARGTRYETHYRVAGRDGRERHVLARGDTKLGKGGEPLRLSGVVLDITARVRAEEAARRTEAARRRAFEGARIGAWNLAFPSLELSADPRFWELFGVAKPTDFEGAVAIIHPEDRDFVRSSVMASLDAKNPVPYSVEYRVVHPGGSVRWVAAAGRGNFRTDGTERTAISIDGTIFDVTDRREAEAALREAYESLEARVTERTAELARAVEQAESFNYSISHDLRAPLRAMASTSSILLDELGPELSAEHRELLERQAHNASRLGRLIDELLRLSRYSRVEVRRQSLDMGRKASSVFADLEEQGRTNGCRFEPEEGMAASGDPDLVRAVLHNLLGNACKFSPKGGTVRMRQEGEVFSIADEGVGFEMRHAERMFRPFERLVSDAEFEGTGIGLANVTRIAERHGGRAWAESDGPGKGATFCFTLG